MLSIPRAPLQIGLAACLWATGCSGLVANLAADALSGQGAAFGSDDDPELIREAIPFGLKTIESLLDSSPENAKLLLAAASGFTQYAYAFVQNDAEQLEESSPELARREFQRAKKLLARGREYGFRGLESEHTGFRAAFALNPLKAVTRAQKRDVPLLYWTGAALAAEISLSKDDMGMLGRLPEVEALMSRALELDEAFADGSIHEFFISYEARGESMGGSLKRAKAHYDRVLELTRNNKIGPLVTWAEVVAVQDQNRKLFDELLDKALSFDVDQQPRLRLVNLIAQRRARWLKAREGDLFLEN
jgi:predicted anti-sigma-YlaC factor YlaD